MLENRNADKLLDIQSLIRRECVFLGSWYMLPTVNSRTFPSLRSLPRKRESHFCWLLVLWTTWIHKRNSEEQRPAANAIQGLGGEAHEANVNVFIDFYVLFLPVKSENTGKLSASVWQASIRLLKSVPTGSRGCPTQPSRLVIEVMLLWGSSV